jgi:hypothetical protein
MTTQDENRDFPRDDSFDPFPKPQTIPAGWDLSELLSAPQPSVEPGSDPSAEAGED